jgi:DNA-binding MarR family transcriptional regulator
LNYKAANVSGDGEYFRGKRNCTKNDRANNDARALLLALTEEGQNAVVEINKYRNMRVEKISEKLNERHT